MTSSPRNLGYLREASCDGRPIIGLKTRTKSSGEGIPGLVRSIRSEVTIARRKPSGSNAVVMADKRIPVTEAAQRVVEAMEEVVSYELRGTRCASISTIHVACIP